MLLQKRFIEIILRALGCLNLTGGCHFSNLRHVCGDSVHALQSPGVSGVEMKIYETSLQALLSLAPRLSVFASLTQMGELARRLALNKQTIITLRSSLRLKFPIRKQHSWTPTSTKGKDSKETQSLMCVLISNQLRHFSIPILVSVTRKELKKASLKGRPSDFSEQTLPK